MHVCRDSTLAGCARFVYPPSLEWHDSRRKTEAAAAAFLIRTLRRPESGQAQSMNSALLGLCVGAAVAALLLIYAAIRSLLRLTATGEIATLPVRPLQSVALAAGEVELALRGRQFSTGFGGVSFELRDARTRHPVSSRALFVRSKTTSLAGDVKLAVMRFQIPQAGDYALAADGLHADVDYADARLVLQRAQGAALTFRILWLVGAGMLLVVAVVGAGLLATGIVSL
jgi:hypothetical protein